MALRWVVPLAFLLISGCGPAEEKLANSSCVLDQSKRSCSAPINCQNGAEADAYDDAYDAAIKSAITEAQKSLPVFWNQLDHRDPLARDFALRVRRPTPNGSREYLWLKVLRRAETTVTLLNDADLPIREGEYPEITAPLTDIVDWTYTKGGKRYGEFTLRAVLDKQCRGDAQRLKAMLSQTPLETETH